MSQYRAKDAYKDKTEVSTYDDRRFRSWKGRTTDRLERKMVVRALAGIPAGSRVLDVPCGTGRITQLLLELGYKTVGADVSSEMLEAAHRSLGDHQNLEALEEADAERLRYADGEFDAVTSIRLMNHVPPDVRVGMLREMARVSRSSVIVSHCNPMSVSAIIRRIKARLRPRPMSWNPATYSQVAREAEQAGLEVSAVYPILGFISETNVYLLTRRS